MWAFSIIILCFVFFPPLCCFWVCIFFSNIQKFLQVWNYFGFFLTSEWAAAEVRSMFYIYFHGIALNCVDVSLKVNERGEKPRNRSFLPTARRHTCAIPASESQELLSLVIKISPVVLLFACNSKTLQQIQYPIWGGFSSYQSLQILKWGQPVLTKKWHDLIAPGGKFKYSSASQLASMAWQEFIHKQLSKIQRWR